MLIIGWNYDAKGELYWICKNQWGIFWGIAGYFKIYAGEAGLDSTGYACTPDIE